MSQPEGKATGAGYGPTTNPWLFPARVVESVEERGRSARMKDEIARLGQRYAAFINWYIEENPQWRENVWKETVATTIESLRESLSKEPGPIPKLFSLQCRFDAPVEFPSLSIAPTPPLQEAEESKTCNFCSGFSAWFSNWRFAMALMDRWSDYRDTEQGECSETPVLCLCEETVQEPVGMSAFRLETLQAIAGRTQKGFKFPSGEGQEADEGKELLKRLCPDGSLTRNPITLEFREELRTGEIGGSLHIDFKITVGIHPLTFDFKRRNSNGGPEIYFPFVIQLERGDEGATWEELPDNYKEELFRVISEDIDEKMVPENLSFPAWEEEPPITKISSSEEMGKGAQDKEICIVNESKPIHSEASAEAKEQEIEIQQAVRRSPKPTSEKGSFPKLRRESHAIISHTLGKFTPYYQPDLFDKALSKETPDFIAKVGATNISFIGYDFDAGQHHVIEGVKNLNAWNKYPEKGVLHTNRNELAVAMGLEKIPHSKTGVMNYSGGEIARAILNLQEVALTPGMINVTTLTGYDQEGKPRYSGERTIAPIFTISITGNDLTEEEERTFKTGAMTESIAAKIKKFTIILNPLWNRRGDYFYAPANLHGRTAIAYARVNQGSGRRARVQLTAHVINFRNWLLQQAALKAHEFSTGKAGSFVVSETFQNIARQCRMENLLSQMKPARAHNAIRQGALLCKEMGVLIDWKQDPAEGPAQTYHFTFTDENGLISPYYQEIEEERQAMARKNEEIEARRRERAEKRTKKHPEKSISEASTPEEFEVELVKLQKSLASEIKRIRKLKSLDRIFESEISKKINHWKEACEEQRTKTGVDQEKQKAVCEVWKSAIRELEDVQRGASLPEIPKAPRASSKALVPEEAHQAVAPMPDPAAAAVWSPILESILKTLPEKYQDTVSEAIPTGIEATSQGPRIVLWFRLNRSLFFFQNYRYFEGAAHAAGVLLAWTSPDMTDPTPVQGTGN